ncbi:MAG: hypothetical protein LBU32_24745 [Clostridiales bacterium]|jgi:hypothetical protein|nr:hypothetical protein [Clostridiales bacterium]
MPPIPAKRRTAQIQALKAIALYTSPKAACMIKGVLALAKILLPSSDFLIISPRTYTFLLKPNYALTIKTHAASERLPAYVKAAPPTEQSCIP